MVHLCIILLWPIVLGGSGLAAVSPIFLSEGSRTAVRISIAAAAPAIFCLAYLILAGLFSLPFQKAIVSGKFPRKLSNPVYGRRRVYGLCWNIVFYSGPIYVAVLSIPLLRKYFFKLFGYRGDPDFTVQPDTWIRDLPILELSKGVYVANKATIGTNICLLNGFVLVDKVKIGKNSMIGHLAMVAPGALIGSRAEIGVGAAIGIRARIQDGTRVGGCSAINHGADIGKNCEIGTMSYIGVRTVVGDGIRVPAGANLPAGAMIRSQADLERYVSSETEVLNKAREKGAAVFVRGLRKNLSVIPAALQDDEKVTS